MTYWATVRKTFRKARNWSVDVGGQRPRNGANNTDTLPRVGNIDAITAITTGGIWRRGRDANGKLLNGLPAKCTKPMSAKRAARWAKKLGV